MNWKSGEKVSWAIEDNNYNTEGTVIEKVNQSGCVMYRVDWGDNKNKMINTCFPEELKDTWYRTQMKYLMNTLKKEGK